MSEVRDGYKMTELGEIPVEWRIVELNEIADVKGGKRLPKGEQLLECDTGLPYIRVSDMDEKGLNVDNIMYVPEHVAPKISNYRIYKDEIYISVAGTLGLIGIVPEELDGANLTENADRICNIKIDNVYLKYYLKSPFIQNAVNSVRTTSAQPKLALNQIKSFQILLPTKEEQKKIASILSTVDEQIDETEQLIVKTKELKKGLMQKLLTKGIGHKEFKQTELGEIPVEWEVLSIKQIVETEDRYAFAGGPFGSDLTSKEYKDSGVQVIQLQNIGEGYFNNNSKVFVSNEKADELLKCNIYPGEIIVAKMAEPVARACIIPNKANRYVMASDGIRVKVDTQSNDTKYIMFAINSQYFRKNAELASTGSTRMRIGLTTLGRLPLLVPPLEEQQKIAQILSTVDEQIEVYEQEKAKYEELKKGLMQQLLTGQIRVKI